MLTRLRLALALAILSCGPALAADCVQGTGIGNKGQCYPAFVPIDPTTGQTVSPGGSGSASATGDVTNAGTSGAKAQAVQGATGGVPLAVTWTGQTVAISGTVAVNNTQLGGVAIAAGPGASNTGTQRVILATDNPTVTISGTVTANLGTLNGAALDTSVQQVKTALGTPFQAGGSIGNTGFAINGTLPAFAAVPAFKIDQTTPGTTNKVSIGTDGTVSQGAAGSAAWKVDGSGVVQPVNGTVTVNQGTPAAIANAWPTYISQGGAALSSSNGLPTTDTNAAQTITAPGTGGAKVQGVQGVSGGVPVPINPYYGGSAAAVGQGTGAVVTVQRVILAGESPIGASSVVGGVSSFSRIPSIAASTNLTNAKATAGRVYKIVGFNAAAAPRRIKFYNVASVGGVTVGTTAVYFSRVLPVGAFSYDVGDIGWYFNTGITYAITTGAADADTTAPAAGDITDLSVEYQ